MKSAVTLFFLSSVLGITLIGQPTIVLDKTFGGPLNDFSRMIRQTPDGGYIIAGDTENKGAGGLDIYLVKTDAAGNMQWDRTYGFANIDRIQWSMNNGLQILYNPDATVKGYVMVGTTTSYSGHGAGGQDFYLIRTDADGNELWSKIFGGAYDDYGRAVRATADGGFIISGQTASFGVLGIDIYIIKTDADGNVEWDVTYNLANDENGYNILEVPDGYLITGDSYGSNGGAYVFKIDLNGNPVPSYGTFPQQPGTGFKGRTGGGYYQLTPNGIGYYIEPVTGGYMVLGTNNSGGIADALLARLDSDGNIVAGWPRNISGPGTNFSYVIHEVPGPSGPGYIIAGETNGIGAGNWDFWVTRTDLDANVQWVQTYGGPGNEWCTSMILTNDGGFAMTGINTSFGAGAADFWLLKVKDIVNPARIEGRLFADNNGNCSFGPGNSDYGLSNQNVKLEPGPYFAKTDGEGKYSFKIEPGSYLLMPSSSSLFEVDNCTTNTILPVVVSSGQHSIGNNFPMEPLGGPECLSSIQIISAPFVQGPCIPPATLSSPCPGFQHKYVVSICNESTHGTINLSHSTLQIFLPSGMTYISGSIMDTCQVSFEEPVTGFQGQTQTLTWDNSNLSGTLKATQCCSFEFIVDVSAVATAPFSISSIFNSWCNGSADGTSISMDNLTEYDYCSCDPNDMTVSPKGCGPEGNIEFGEELTYRIRFQNIGTGNAHDVVLRDTLDNDFEVSSLRIIESNYTVTGVQLEPGNILVISFEDIELEPWAIGEVFFSLMHKNNLPEGTTLTNRAGINFDENPPVITNTTLNTLRNIAVPDAAFTVDRECSTTNTSFNFEFTGQSLDGSSYYWDFGPNALPASSTEQNPEGITFTSQDPQEVLLIVSRYGCEVLSHSTVEIKENIPPVALCKNFIVALDIEGQAVITASQADDGSNDNCGIADLSLSQYAFDCTHLGINHVALTVTDWDGNSGTCESTVTVQESLFITELEKTNESCANYGDGTISISAFTSCLSEQVFYSIDGGNSFNLTGEFYSLTPGTYDILVQTASKTFSETVAIEPGISSQAWYKDADNDGYSNGVTQISCIQPSGFKLESDPTILSLTGDCNDNDALQRPGQIWYKDADNDGYSSGATKIQCTRPVGYKAASELEGPENDCNDANSSVFPYTNELCNGMDDNCNSIVDDGAPATTFVGNKTFTTQSQLNEWPLCYTVIQGNLTIQGSGITSLAPLSNLSQVTGNVTIKLSSLSNLSGLNNLESIGGALMIFSNNAGAKLISLNGLDALSAIGGSLSIYYNYSLTNCCPIYELVNEINGHSVGGSISIHHNMTGCDNITQINTNCAGGNSIIAPPGDTFDENETTSPALACQIFPNPVVEIFTLKFADQTPKKGELLLLDLCGRIVLREVIPSNQQEYSLSIASLSQGVYFVKVLEDGLPFWVEKVIKQ